MDSAGGAISVQQFPGAFQQARSVISDLDGSSATPGLLGLPRWISLLNVLQKIAYLDADGGGERDIASWCERQWATILQDHPQNVPALQGRWIDSNLVDAIF